MEESSNDIFSGTIFVQILKKTKKHSAKMAGLPAQIPADASRKSSRTSEHYTAYVDLETVDYPSSSYKDDFTGK